MRWLLKAEPNTRFVKGINVKYTIDDLKENGTVTYGRIRNFEAKKYLNQMKLGDQAFFYRSNCKEPAIVGTMRVCKEAYPDPAATNPDSPFYDPKNGHQWVVVDFEYESHLNRPVLLSEIKANSELSDMYLVRRFRLSVTPVNDDEWNIIMKLAGNESIEPQNKRREVHSSKGATDDNQSSTPEGAIPDDKDSTSKEESTIPDDKDSTSKEESTIPDDKDSTPKDETTIHDDKDSTPQESTEKNPNSTPEDTKQNDS